VSRFHDVVERSSARIERGSAVGLHRFTNTLPVNVSRRRKLDDADMRRVHVDASERKFSAPRESAPREQRAYGLLRALCADELNDVGILG
jgi:hypothetical protein